MRVLGLAVGGAHGVELGGFAHGGGDGGAERPRCLVLPRCERAPGCRRRGRARRLRRGGLMLLRVAVRVAVCARLRLALLEDDEVEAVALARRAEAVARAHGRRCEGAEDGRLRRLDGRRLDVLQQRAHLVLDHLRLRRDLLLHLSLLALDAFHLAGDAALRPLQPGDLVRHALHPAENHLHPLPERLAAHVQRLQLRMQLRARLQPPIGHVAVRLLVDQRRQRLVLLHGVERVRVLELPQQLPVGVVEPLLEHADSRGSLGPNALHHLPGLISERDVVQPLAQLIDVLVRRLRHHLLFEHVDTLAVRLEPLVVAVESREAGNLELLDRLGSASRVRRRLRLDHFEVGHHFLPLRLARHQLVQSADMAPVNTANFFVHRKPVHHLLSVLVCALLRVFAQLNEPLGLLLLRLLQNLPRDLSLRLGLALFLCLLQNNDALSVLADLVDGDLVPLD
mmetsp:Transcript_53609/g.116866  ORF Transcript_53609/g.116866 Transcript_53609/m.116866 type:complete len:453 (+) Transcript_53609:428-1786(+)